MKTHSPTQHTVKRAVEAWHWILNNEHHFVGTEFRKDGTTLAVFMKNYHHKMRIPEKLIREVMSGIRANTRPFDSRMYMLTPEAKRKVTRG